MKVSTRVKHLPSVFALLCVGCGLKAPKPPSNTSTKPSGQVGTENAAPQGNAPASSSQSEPSASQGKSSDAQADSQAQQATASLSLSEKLEELVANKDNEAILPVDVVWAVSGRFMATTGVTTVKNGLAKFLDLATQQGDKVRVAVIAAGDSALMGQPTALVPVNVSATHLAAGVKQFSFLIEPQGLLSSIAAAVCPQDKTNVPDGSKGTLCGQSFAPSSQRRGLNDIRGRAASEFFRKDSRKVIVTAGTNDSVDLTGKEFLDMVRPQLGQTPQVFAYTLRAATRATCGDFTLTEPATEITNAASLSGGETMDFCSSDWSPLFAKMTAQSLGPTYSELTLSATDIEKITEVQVAGTVIDASAYKLVGNKLEISPLVKIRTGYKVLVKYQPKK